MIEAGILDPKRDAVRVAAHRSDRSLLLITEALIAF
jgi:hypothetical protein